MALAHGYARVTGRPLAVALHANVGLMHATMAIFNAWCDRIPILLLGGVGPIDAVQAPAVGRLDPHVARPRRARSRLHEVGRPAGLGRRPRSRRSCARYRIATTPPQGPVYVVPRRGAAGGSARGAAAAARARSLSAGRGRRARRRTRCATVAALLARRAAAAAHDRPRVERSRAISTRRVALAERLGARRAHRHQDRRELSRRSIRCIRSRRACT